MATPERPRRFLQSTSTRIGIAASLGVLGIAGIGIGLARLGNSPTRDNTVAVASATLTDVPLSAEQQKALNALNELNNFMNTYTNDKTVDNFIRSASVNTKTSAFNFGNVSNDHSFSPVQGWNLMLPDQPTNAEPAIVFITDPSNPKQNEGMTVFLNKKGGIRKDVDGHNKNALGENWTQEEMKTAITTFFKSPPGYNLYTLIPDSYSNPDQQIAIVIFNGSEILHVRINNKGTVLIARIARSPIPIAPTSTPSGTGMS